MPIVVDIDVMLARRKMPVGTLADRVGITPANLAVLKNGRAKAVRFTTLAALCDVLACQPGDLLGWEPDPEPAARGQLLERLDDVLAVGERIRFPSSSMRDPVLVDELQDPDVEPLANLHLQRRRQPEDDRPGLVPGPGVEGADVGGGHPDQHRAGQPG